MNEGLVLFVCETYLSSRVVCNVGQLWHALFAQIFLKYFLIKFKKHTVDKVCILLVLLHV